MLFPRAKLEFGEAQYRCQAFSVRLAATSRDWADVASPSLGTSTKKKSCVIASTQVLRCGGDAIQHGLDLPKQGISSGLPARLMPCLSRNWPTRDRRVRHFPLCRARPVRRRTIHPHGPVAVPFSADKRYRGQVAERIRTEIAFRCPFRGRESRTQFGAEARPRSRSHRSSRGVASSRLVHGVNAR